MPLKFIFHNITMELKRGCYAVFSANSVYNNHRCLWNATGHWGLAS